MSSVPERASSILSCVAYDWKENLCAVTVTQAVCSCLTFFLSIFCIIRTVRITKIRRSPQVFVQSCVLLQMSCMIVYWTAYDIYWLHHTLELMKLTTFFATCFYFSLGVHSFGLLPDFVQRRGIIGAFSVNFLMVFSCYVLSIILDTQGCKNIARLFFGIFQFMFAILFTTITAVFLLRRSDQSRKKVSESFMNRHTRPMATVAVAYCFTSVIYVTLRVFFFIETDYPGQSCTVVLRGLGQGFSYFYAIFRLVDNIMPNLFILWYFYMTIRPPPSSVTVNVNKRASSYVDQYSQVDDDEFLRHTSLIKEVLNTTDKSKSASTSKFGVYTAVNQKPQGPQEELQDKPHQEGETDDDIDFEQYRQQPKGIRTSGSTLSTGKYQSYATTPTSTSLGSFSNSEGSGVSGSSRSSNNY